MQELVCLTYENHEQRLFKNVIAIHIVDESSLKPPLPK